MITNAKIVSISKKIRDAAGVKIKRLTKQQLIDMKKDKWINDFNKHWNQNKKTSRPLIGNIEDWRIK